VNLTEDKNCWQCGWRLASTQAAAMATGTGESAIVIPTANKESKSLPVPAFFLYIAFTAVLVLLAFIAMWQLGQAPLLQTSSADWEGGWLPMDDPSAIFTINMPPNWSTAGIEDVEFAVILADDDKWLEAVRPLSDRVTDETILFIAEPLPTAEKFAPHIAIVVMQSSELSRFSPNMLIQAPNKDERYNLHFGDDIDNLAKSHVAIEFSVLDLQPERRCRQQITNGDETALVIAVCSQSNQFGGLMPIFDRILGSFQQLAP
jgi:hypothetical protein